ACSLARALRVPRVLIPALPGALSAVGILLADTIREYSRTVMLPIDATLEEFFAELEAAGAEDFRREGLEGESHRSVDLRYRGQGYELTVPFSPQMAADFHELHRLRYGFADPARPMEAVNVRVRMISPSEPFVQARQPLREGDSSHAMTGSRPVWFDGSFVSAPVYDRGLLAPGDRVIGPAIVTEYSSATILPPGDRLRVDELGNLVIEVHG
ncbi:MAG: hydantoinase/oxoprolinase family protein, partial [Terracidiphilus sp.]